MRALYPCLRAHDDGFLDVSDDHRLYYQIGGNPDGVPVVVLHGGPGGSCSPNQFRFFDPSRYRIILFDQRGCGRSTPHAALENNTTSHLIADIEALRNHLNVNRWLVFGGSWGATLGLLYAQAHPKKILGLILRGTYLARQKDVEWVTGPDGMARVFPEAFAEFKSLLPKAEQANFLKAYHERLSGENEIQRMDAAKHWATYEASCSSLVPNHEYLACAQDPSICLPWASLESHYLMNHYFIEENQVLDNMHLLKDIPINLIHGRYDMVCLLEGAHEIAQKWDNATLDIVRSAGHSASEPGIIDALVKATDAWLKGYGVPDSGA